MFTEDGRIDEEGYRMVISDIDVRATTNSNHPPPSHRCLHEIALRHCLNPTSQCIFQMPIMTGVEFCTAVRKDLSRQLLPILAHSANPQYDTKCCKEAGFNGRLLKPGT
jgi:hypothetical protein